jgi:hypothetical protein
MSTYAEIQLMKADNTLVMAIDREDSAIDREQLESVRTVLHEQWARLEAVRELHAEDLFRGHLSNGCRTCGQTGDVGYPCPTIAAITVTEGA